jgi:hypothetical protein
MVASLNGDATTDLDSLLSVAEGEAVRLHAQARAAGKVIV